MTLLEKIRKFYKDGIIGDPDTNKCAAYLGKLFNCDVFILNEKGGFWGVYCKKPIACSIIQEMLSRGMMDVSNMARINVIKEGNIHESCFNPLCDMNIRKKCPYKGKMTYEIPAIAFDKRVGTVLFICDKQKFSDEEKAVFEMIVMTMAFEGLFWIEKRRGLQEEKKIKMQKFLSSLSITEVKAVEKLIVEMGGATEKRVVTSKIADKAGITRSVVLSALKKLKGAGLGEFVSMGQSGTFIKLEEDVTLENMKKV